MWQVSQGKPSTPGAGMGAVISVEDPVYDT